MPRTIVTTCGTSLLESSCWQLSDQEKRIYPLQRISELKNRNAPKNEIDAMKANRTSWLEGFKENNQVNELVNKFDVNTWNNKNLIDLPAELASLRAIDLYFRQQINQPLINDDKIILLHSPTYGSNNEGPFCANVIHNIINRYNLLPSQLFVKEIPNLNPLDRDNFSSGLQQLETYVRKVLVNCESAERLYLNLTAGYKAFAIQLAGFAAKFLGVTIFYLYEETDCDQIQIITFNEDRGQFRSVIQIVSLQGL